MQQGGALVLSHIISEAPATSLTNAAAHVVAQAVRVMQMHAAVGRRNLVIKWCSCGKSASLEATTEKLSQAHMCTGLTTFTLSH